MAKILFIEKWIQFLYVCEYTHTHTHTEFLYVCEYTHTHTHTCMHTHTYFV